MKAKILEKLDDKLKEAEIALTPVKPNTYSSDYGYWKGLLDAREIIQKTEEETVKYG